MRRDYTAVAAVMKESVVSFRHASFVLVLAWTLMSGAVFGQAWPPAPVGLSEPTARDRTDGAGGRPSVAAPRRAVSAGPTADLTQVARDLFQHDYPQASLFAIGGLLVRVYGTTLGYGADPNDSAEQFRLNHGRMFGVAPEDLRPDSRLPDGRHTQPLMHEPETGRYKFTLVCYSQYQDGLPVFRSELRMLVRNEPGYPLVWVGSSLHDLGDFRALNAAYDEEEGRRAAKQAVAGLSNFSPAEPVVWAGIDEHAERSTVALTFVGDNDGATPAQQPERWLFVTDAATGEILHQESLILLTDVTGQVHGMATTPPKSAECNPEADTAMSYAKVVMGGTTAYADIDGSFSIPNSGTDPVTVTSFMSGPYFNVVEQTGTIETLTMGVTPPGPANFMYNSANTDEHIRAQVNAYVQANKVRDWVLVQNPSYPTIPTQTGFTLNVNYNQTCNAYYDTLPSLNFFLAGGGCANSAFAIVVYHEYGHHLCQVAGAGQDQYGEGVGDSIAVCITDDPVFAYGWNGDCDTGPRTADNSMLYPCTSDGHTCGQLLSGCVWSTRNQLAATNPGTYLSILSSLMVNSIPMHAGSSTINPAIYTDWVTLDGGPSGPHYAEITAGFQAHNMVPGVPPPNNACADAITLCPGTYGGTTSGATVNGTVSCDASYGGGPDVWYTYTPGSSGSATFSLCSSPETWDSVLSVHSGCPGTTGNQLNCNNDGCGGTATHGTITRSVTGGTTYIIRVGGHAASNSGPFTLTITGPACAEPTGACCYDSAPCAVVTQSACTSDGGNYQGNDSNCSPDPCPPPCTLLGDVNQDGAVNGLDVAGFVRAKLGQAPEPGENQACASFGTGTLDGELAAFINALLS